MSTFPPVDSVAELEALLGLLRGADRLPWPGAAATMVEERRALTLARQAALVGQALLSAVFTEMERLLASTD